MNTLLSYRRFFPLTVLIFGILDGVTERGLRAQETGCHGVGDVVVVRPVKEDPNLCLDCITLTPEVTLGEEDGTGYIEREGSDVARDGLGRYWVMVREGAKVFSPQGNFLRVVGRSGQGPGEFIWPTEVTTGPGGSIYIFDGENARITRFDNHLSVDTTARVPGYVRSAAFLPRGAAYVANMVIYQEGHIGRSLHTMSMADQQPVTSFALAPDGSTLAADLKVVVDGEGVIYAGNRDAYAISLWTEQGESLGCLVREDLFTPRPDPLVRATPAGEIPEFHGLITDIHVDEEGLLWVSAWVPKEGWRDNIIRVERPDRPPLFRRGPAESVYTNVVEVLDPRRAVILARLELQNGPLIVGFLDGGIAYGTKSTDMGAPQIAVSRIHFRPKHPHGR